MNDDLWWDIKISLDLRGNLVTYVLRLPSDVTESELDAIAAVFKSVLPEQPSPTSRE